MTTGTVPAEVVVAGGYLYRPEPSYFDDEVSQQQLFEKFLGADTLRRLDVFSQCALFALEQARRISDTTRSPVPVPSERHGVCVGTGFGSQATRIRYARRLARLGPAATNPIDFPDSIDGAAAAHIAMRWGLKGPSLTFADGSGTAENVIVAACRQIALGRADRMYLAVGDIYEPWLKAFLAAGDASKGPIQGPCDAILALVLEKPDAGKHSDTRTRLVGFFDGGDNSRFRDVTPSRTFELDPSGVLQAAGAWLEVTAPMGTAARSCQDDALVAECSRVSPTGRTCLAFWRKVDSG